MILFDQYARNADAVRAEARTSNTTISYTEAAYGKDVILEYPDGRRERSKSDGTVEVLPTIAC